MIRFIRHTFYACAVIVLTAPSLAQARPVSDAPFTRGPSNTVPLAFGMGVDDAARALRAPLHYLSGKRGNEIFLAYRDVGGSALMPRADRLYLQFRRGRLTGWKGDWGQPWLW